jgi:hypothetical protein
MGHNTQSHRKRYISIPGIGLTLLILFVLYSATQQTEAFTTGIHNVGSWLQVAADWVLWGMNQTPNAE